MSLLDAGGPAFPVPGFSTADGDVFPSTDGMTLRDYFAAKAMQAELTTCGVPGEACEAMLAAATGLGREPFQHIALNAYELADAMLEARQK